MRGVGATHEGAPTSVVIGLSSGVDSSVAAWLLKQRGYRVLAVTLALAEPGGDESIRSCCSPTLMAKAKAIANHLGVPHYAINTLEDFRTHVVDYFVSEYEAGRTPNPCAKCNSRVRFSALLEVADRLGARWIATGHYARLTGHPRRLTRAVDRQKDQSYVLAEVAPLELERCIFPLGDMTKGEVRRTAREIGLADLVSAESQEICFVPGERHREFLRARLGERPGALVDEDGNVLGTHTGTYNYTIGQRKGIGLGGGPPLYVASVDADSREVQVVSEGKGAVGEIWFDVSAIQRPCSRECVEVQFRSMGNTTRGRLRGEGHVVLETPAEGVAPGQTLVVYEGEDVILAGTITSTCRSAPEGHV